MGVCQAHSVCVHQRLGGSGDASCLQTSGFGCTLPPPLLFARLAFSGFVEFSISDSECWIWRGKRLGFSSSSRVPQPCQHHGSESKRGKPEQ